MTDPRQHSEDYISFEGIKAVVFQVMKAVFYTVNYGLRLFRKYWMLFLLFCGTGVGIGYLAKHYVAYNSNLTLLVKFNDLNLSTYSQIITSLSELATGRSDERLAYELGIKPADAEQISDITIEKAGKEEETPTTVLPDSVFKKSSYLITVALRGMASADVIQSALISFINDNPYIKKLKDGQFAYNTEKLLFLNSELRKMDSLKNEYNQSIATLKNPTSIYYNAFNPADIYIGASSLMREKEKLAQWFATEQQAMDLISSFKQERILSKRSNKAIIGGFGIGLLLSLFIVMWQELKIRIRQEEKRGSTNSEGI
jgi:hypothetical protein